MSRLPKIVINKTVVALTTSVEEGLMFPPNPLINDILVGCLAKAQALHPLEICDIVIEATHVHMIAVVGDPNDVKGFMERFKTESAHAVNRLLGRKKRTVWCEGYDSPTLLTPEDVINKIAYTYENPSKDGLEDRIEKYPGVSGFRFRGMESGVMEAPLVARHDLDVLPTGDINEDDYRRLARKLGYGKKRIKLKLSPNAWMKCFNITEPEGVRTYNARILREIRIREEGHRVARRNAGSDVIGWRRLVNTPIGREFRPQRSGRRMWCICYDKKLRRRFIRWAKNLVCQARAVLERWRRGDRSIPYPPGLYPPSMPKIAEMIFC
jgi:REP element-mobilizing transposase RayT